MKVAPARIREIALAIALLAAPAGALAQQQVPTQNGNVWDWRAHQPSEAGVQRKEQAAGVAPSVSQRDHAAATVDNLYRELLDTRRG